MLNQAVVFFTYDNYLWELRARPCPVWLPARKQLVGRDQKNRVLEASTSRAPRAGGLRHGEARGDDHRARVPDRPAALVLQVGTVLGAEDVVSRLGDEARELPGIVGNVLLHAVLLAVLGLAVAAYTPRRAYATGGIIALFLILGVVSGIVGELSDEGGWRYVLLISPFPLVGGVREWFFGGRVADSPVDLELVSGPAHCSPTSSWSWPSAH
jgi:ABC-2 type transport system permease protein